MAEVEQQPETPVTPPKKRRILRSVFTVTTVDAGFIGVRFGGDVLNRPWLEVLIR